MKLQFYSAVFGRSLVGMVALLISAGCAGIGTTSQEQSMALSPSDRKAEEVIRGMSPQSRQAVLQVVGTDPVGREARLMQAVDSLEQGGRSDTALRLLMLGAELEFPEAQFRIVREFQQADMHKEAHESLLKAARQGHPGAQYRLGVMYADGIGIERDVRQATHWLQQAGDSGLRDALVKLKEVQKSSGE